MKRHLFFIISSLMSVTIMAQDSFSSDTISKDDEPVFIVVEEMPEFQGGGIDNFMKYVIQNAQIPEISQKYGIQTRFIVQFVVGKDGFVKNAEMLRGLDPAMDTELIKVILSSPQWKPGKQHGEPVNVQYTMPVNIDLQ